MTSSAIAATGLRKAFGDKIVLDGIDLDVRAGTVFSLLGPNGAGKTTTVNVLTTLMKADGGTVRVAGHDVATETKAVRATIGVTGQFAAVDELLTGRENLQLMADLKRLGSGEGGRIVTELLERFDLTEAAQKLVSTYSRRYAPEADATVVRLLLDGARLKTVPSRLTVAHLRQLLAGGGQRPGHRRSPPHRSNPAVALEVDRIVSGN